VAVLTRTFSSALARPALWWLGTLALLALLAPALPLPHQPDVPDLAHVALPPFRLASHWLGTDVQGRDVLSVLVHGARTAATLTVPAAVLAALLGAAAGGAAGFWGTGLRIPVPYYVTAVGLAWWLLRLPAAPVGLVITAFGVGLSCWPLTRRWAQWALPIDALVLGLCTALDTLPRLVLVVVVAAWVGVSEVGLLALMALISWPSAARLVRAHMLRVRALPFVEAAQASGYSAGRVWLRHALPHAVQPLRTALPLSLAGLLGLESTLSFLGIGLPPNVPSWGRLLANVRTAPEAWWTFAFPAACLVFTMLSLYSLGQIRRR